MLKLRSVGPKPEPWPSCVRNSRRHLRTNELRVVGDDATIGLNIALVGDAQAGSLDQLASKHVQCDHVYFALGSR